MINKLDFLLSEANIGIYNKCEVIEIIAFPKKNKGNPFNIFTLIIFENTKQNNQEEFLTNGLIKLSKDISWGIKKRVIDIEEVRQIYNDLILKNELNLDKKIKIDIGKLKFLSEQYIPPRESMHKTIQINNILKNNFHNGSYILEFFDEEKNQVQFLLDNPILLNSFSEQVSSILPIKIGTLSDRLGNIIFQLPINNVTILKKDKYLTNKYQGILVEIYPKNSNFDINTLILRIYEKNKDGIITRQKLISITNNKTEIKLDDCFGINIEIIDKNTSLLIYKYKFSIIKQAHISGNIIQQQKRVFEINGKKEKLDISTNASYSVIGEKQEQSYNKWIDNRIYDEQLNNLEKNKSFIQYFGFDNEKAKALNDIRVLINQHGKKGVYLWDPYLNAIDIKNTLYFCKSTYVPLKAITALGNQDKRHERESFKQEMITEFEKDDKQFLFLDLEVRGKIGIDGYKFHDRFLIFPQERPKVWSLGISVNQLGASHHILQEVQNAQHILNAFNKLWNELDKEECLVWKSH